MKDRWAPQSINVYLARTSAVRASHGVASYSELRNNPRFPGSQLLCCSAALGSADGSFDLGAGSRKSHPFLCLSSGVATFSTSSSSLPGK